MFRRCYVPRGSRASVCAMPAPASPPASRRGTVASFGSRVLAFVIDGVLADLVAIAALGGFRTGGDGRRVAGQCCCLFPRREVIDDLPVPSCQECIRKSGTDSARAVRTALADWL